MILATYYIILYLENMLQTDKVESNIRVFVRIRPLLENEAGQEAIIQANADGVHVDIIQSVTTIQQQFDAVFNHDCIQRDVFQQIVPGIDQLANGYNSTILAYGQTGSGKTYTMFGSDWEYLHGTGEQDVRVQHQATFFEDLATDKNNAGVIPRSIYHLFNQIGDQGLYVYCSFLQVYNEKIYDLLQETATPLQIHESKLDGIFVEGLTEYAVNHYYDCLTLMKRGEKNRYIRSTSMNMKSSRSHTIFQILLESNKADKGGCLKKSKLNLCDLAGSEKINKLENMNQQHLLELKSINQSLTTLGKVIHNLSQNSTKKHSLPIPYRESKLTRLLQDSLGGNTLAYIIANVASGTQNVDETHSTLKFAERAKNIAVTVKANKISATDSELVQKLVTEKINYLKGMLNMKRKGLNTNDVHLQLMKVKEENDRLRKEFVSVTQVEGLIKENRQMKVELQKMSQAITLGGGSDANSESDHYQKKQDLLDPFQPDSYLHPERSWQQTSSTMDLKSAKSFKIPTLNPTPMRAQKSSSQLKQNGVMVISSMPKTEVEVRVKGRANQIVTRKGYVEQSDQQFNREKQLRNERQRVVERLQLLYKLQKHPEVQEQVTMKTEKGKQQQKIDQYDLKLKIIEQQLIFN